MTRSRGTVSHLEKLKVDAPASRTTSLNRVFPLDDQQQASLWVYANQERERDRQTRGFEIRMYSFLRITDPSMLSQAESQQQQTDDMLRRNTYGSTLLSTILNIEYPPEVRISPVGLL